MIGRAGRQGFADIKYDLDKGKSLALECGDFVCANMQAKRRPCRLDRTGYIFAAAQGNEDKRDSKGVLQNCFYLLEQHWSEQTDVAIAHLEWER